MLSLTTTECLTGRPKWLQIVAKRSLESGQLNKASIGEPTALCKQEVNNKFADTLHINMEDLEKDFPTYMLDEYFLPKLKDKGINAKTLDIEATLTAELHICLAQDEAFWPLSEKLQRNIGKKRVGTLTDIALHEELEPLTEAVISAVEEPKCPIVQQLALKSKDRNLAMTEAQASEVTTAILEKADKHGCPSWWNSNSADPEPSRTLLQLITQRFSSLRLLAGGPMEFIGQLMQVLNRKHYKPESKDA